MANKVLRMGIVGMTSDHIWNMAANLAALPTVELVTGAEPYEELRQRAKDRFHLKTLYEDYHEMFDKEALDAVVVCCDNAGKAGVVEAAAQHGVHAYLDKPMAATLAQADRIVAATESSGIKVMIAYHTAFSASYGKVKGWLQQGLIGDVYLAKASSGHGGPIEFGCSKYFCEWLFDKEKNGGGAFIDVGCYAVSTLLDYFGEVDEVFSVMTNMGWRDYLAPDMEDNSVTTLRFKSGALGVIDAKWGQVGTMPLSNSYHGREGTIIWSWTGVSIYSKKALPSELQGWVAVSAGREPRPGVGSEAGHFVNCVLENRPFEDVVSIRGARAAQEVIEAAYRSAETGQVVKLPL